MAGTPDRITSARTWLCSRCDVYGSGGSSTCWSCGGVGPVLIWSRAPLLSSYHRWPPVPLVESHSPAVLEAEDQDFYKMCRRVEQESPDSSASSGP